MIDNDALGDLGYSLLKLADWLAKPEQFPVAGHTFEDAIYQRGWEHWTDDKNAADNEQYMMEHARYAEELCLSLSEDSDVLDAHATLIVLMETGDIRFYFEDGDADAVVERMLQAAKDCRDNFLRIGGRLVARWKRQDSRKHPGELMVTVRDVAGYVKLGEKSFGNYRKEWPDADEPGRGRIPDRWIWLNLKPTIEKQFPHCIGKLP